MRRRQIPAADSDCRNRCCSGVPPVTAVAVDGVVDAAKLVVVDVFVVAGEIHRQAAVHVCGDVVVNREIRRVVVEKDTSRTVLPAGHVVRGGDVVDGVVSDCAATAIADGIDAAAVVGLDHGIVNGVRQDAYTGGLEIDPVPAGVVDRVVVDFGVAAVVARRPHRCRNNRHRE